MTTTLADLTYELAVELGIVYEGEATSGTTTTLIDTNDLTQADDYWQGGTVWILDDAGGAGAAPQGEYAIASSFTAATDKVTFVAAMTTPPASGDRYAIAKRTYPLYTMIQAINRALRNINILYTNSTAIDTAASQTEYTLPSVAALDLRRVWFQTKINDANDNKWVEIPNWMIQKSATGSADTLILPLQFTSGRDIMLEYMAPHPRLYDSSDQLDESVHIERVIFRAAWMIMNTEVQQTRAQDAYLVDSREYYKSLTQAADVRYPILGPPKRSKLLIADRQTDYVPAPAENTVP